MNKFKEFSLKYWKFAVAAAVGFVIAIPIGPSNADLVSIQEEYNTIKNTSDQYQEDLDVALAENEELSKKVDEAAPWFKLTEAEKKAKEIEAAELEKENERKEQEALEAEEKAKQEAEEKARQERIEANTKTLSTGEYTVGEDIEAGTYNCTAISGNGNFFVYGSYGSLKVNEMFGTNGKYYTSTYNNLELEYGDKITLKGGIQVKFAPVD